MVRPVQLPSAKKLLFKLNLELNELYNNASLEFGHLNDFEKLVVVLEDRRFFSHMGVDYRSVAREIVRLLLRQRHGGASTIDMQFVRTVNSETELTMRRKLKETTVAFLIRFHFNKTALLRNHLEIAYFGTGLNGAEQAADAIFGVPVYRLSKVQAAQLAAMLVYPRPSQPTAVWEAKINRRAEYGLRILPRFEQRLQKI